MFLTRSCSILLNGAKEVAELVESCLAYAQQHGLLMSAGSDSHGPPGRMPIKYHAEMCRNLLERVGIEVH